MKTIKTILWSLIYYVFFGVCCLGSIKIGDFPISNLITLYGVSFVIACGALSFYIFSAYVSINEIKKGKPVSITPSNIKDSVPVQINSALNFISMVIAFLSGYWFAGILLLVELFLSSWFVMSMEQLDKMVLTNKKMW